MPGSNRRAGSTGLSKVLFQESAVAPALTGFLASLRGEVGPQTLRQTATHLKVLWKDLHDTEVMPRSVRKSLFVDVPRDAPSGELIREHEFRALLEEASPLPGLSGGVPTRLVVSTLLWVLYDAGLRAEEALHLMVRDVEFTGLETARIHLRADGRPLKTGPRVVPVSACVPSLRALLSLHPHLDGGKSPLFPGERRRTSTEPCQAGCWCGGTGPMRYEAMRRMLAYLADESGVNEGRPWTANVTAHDFRHTCATNKAILGWNEDLMRGFFGWFKGSKMPSYYVCLNVDTLEQQVPRWLEAWGRCMAGQPALSTLVGIGFPCPGCTIGLLVMAGKAAEHPLARDRKDHEASMQGMPSDW